MYNVTITAGGETVPVSSVVNNINKALAAGRGYADYFIFHSDSGDKAEASERGDANTDPSSLPFVCYGAYLANGSFDITAVSLSGDGVTADLTAVLATPIKKRGGEKLYIEVRVTLDCTCENAALTSGDNPLVRWLLGMGALPSDAVIALSANRSPLYKVSPPFGKYIREYAATATLGESGIKFSARVNVLPVDATLLLGGKAAMRARPVESSAVLSSGSLRANDGAVIFGKEAGRMTGFACNGNPVYDYYINCGRTAIGGKSSFPAKVGENVSFIADGSCRVAAAISDGVAVLIRLSDGFPAVTGERKVYSKPCLTTDGALFSLDGETLVFTAENGDEKRLGSFICDELAAVCSYAGIYDIAVRVGNTAKTFRLSGGALTPTGEYDMGEVGCIGAIDGKRLAVCGKNCGCVIKGRKDYSNTADTIAYMFEDFDVVYMRIFGQMLLFKDSDGTFYAVETYYCDGIDIYGEGEPILSSDVVLYDNSLYLTHTVGNVHEVPLGFHPDAFCRLENFILTAEGGALCMYPLGGSGVRITSDSFTESGLVTFVYSSPTVSSSASLVELGLSFESDDS